MTSLKRQEGFAHVGLAILVIIVVAVIGFAVFKVTKSNNANQQVGIPQSNSTKEEADIVLQNFGLRSMDDVLVTKDALREYDSKGLKGFYAFGDTLGGGNSRKNPNFEFASVKPGAPVIASIDGVITFIKQQPEANDFEVMLQPKDGSVWTIGYDHLTNLEVKRGDIVKAGDILGEPSPQGNGSLRFEIQINKDAPSTIHVCPSTLVGDNQNLLNDLKTMQDKWEQVTGRDLYDTSAQSPIGCFSKTLTPEN